MNDAVLVDEGALGVFTVTSNDTDVDGDLAPTTVSVVGFPANGTIAIRPSGQVEYQHDGSETVSDSFTYTVQDATGLTSNTATVSVTINPVNDAPTANNDTAYVTGGGTVTIDLAANDTDPDDGLDLTSPATYMAPSNGTLVFNGDGTVDYTHDGSATLSDTFQYVISDLAGATATATVDLTIGAPSNGQLYTVRTNDDVLVRIDPTTFVHTDVGPVGVDVDFGELAWDPTRGVLWMIDGRQQSSLYRVDPLTGAATLVGAHGITDLFGLVVDPQTGTLYATGEGPTGLYVLDPTTAAPTLVGDPGVGGDGAAWDTQRDQLVIYEAGGTGRIHELDPNTATPTLLASPGFADNGGMAYEPDADLLYVITVSDEFYSIDPNNGYARTTLAPPGGGFAGLTYKPNRDEERLYAVRNSDDMLVRIDPTSLTLSDVGPLGVGFDFGELAWDSTRGVMWMIDGRGQESLYTVDLNTGAATLVGPHGITDLFGLAVDPVTGILYATGESPSGLYTLDPATGAATFIGDPGDQADGLTWDTTRDRLVGLSASSGNLYEIDTATGAGTFIAYDGNPNNCGVAYHSGTDEFWAIDHSGTLWSYDASNAYLRTDHLSLLGAHDGLTFVPGGGAAPAMVGSYLVNDGPLWSSNPAVLSCVEACAQIFGGAAGDYQCSTDMYAVDNQAWTSTWGGPCALEAEDYSLDQGGGYDCGVLGCSTSAYVSDHCYNEVNYCWQ